MSGRSRTRWLVRAALLGAVLLPVGFPVLSFAADAAAFQITGQVQHAGAITLQDLEKRPFTTVQVSFETARGQEQGSFTGVLLWSLLGDTGLVDQPGKNARLRHTILVTGRDGYAAALSLGEMDPDFEGKSVILAYAKDGKPLDPADGIRLIVPGDHHGGRDVHDVTTIDVR